MIGRDAIMDLDRMIPQDTLDCPAAMPDQRQPKLATIVDDREMLRVAVELTRDLQDARPAIY